MKGLIRDEASLAAINSLHCAPFCDGSTIRLVRAPGFSMCAAKPECETQLINRDIPNLSTSQNSTGIGSDDEHHPRHLSGMLHYTVIWLTH